MLHAAPERVAQVAVDGCDERRRLGEGPLEFGLVPGYDVEKGVLEDHRPRSLPLDGFAGTPELGRQRLEVPEVVSHGTHCELALDVEGGRERALRQEKAADAGD